MVWAVNNMGAAQKIDLDHIREIHRRLVFGRRLEPHGGVLGDRQNWIGGGDYSPCEAQFVPPPPQEVERLLDDLCNFCNADDLPSIAQAAIAHAQFETIHPLADGNGRTIWALIHVILRLTLLLLRL